MAAKPFLTPQNERSFSALVDRVVLETGREHALLSVLQYVNLTVRECQALGLFAKDLLEEEVVATASPHIFTRPRNWRSLRTVKYDQLSYYPKMVRPGRAIEKVSAYYYAADDYYAFHGVTVGESIFTAAYYWAKPLQYFGLLGTITTGFQGGPYTIRPAYFNITDDLWYYLNAGQTAYVTSLGNLTEEALRRRNSFNWVLDEWWDVVVEGVKAKLFKQYKDERAPAAYAAYQNGLEIFKNTMVVEAEVTSNFGETI